jgi:hypothetical protein
VTTGDEYIERNVREAVGHRERDTPLGALRERETTSYEPCERERHTQQVTNPPTSCEVTTVHEYRERRRREREPSGTERERQQVSSPPTSCEATTGYKS